MGMCIAQGKFDSPKNRNYIAGVRYSGCDKWTNVMIEEDKVVDTFNNFYGKPGMTFEQAKELTLKYYDKRDIALTRVDEICDETRAKWISFY
mgnify:FL=1|jgi:hypothetical protein